MEAGVILCIDDERIVLNGLQAQLSRDFGTTYSIEIAESGEEAFEIIEELLSKGIAIPVVISDELMPGIKGHELLTKIHIKSPATYTILLTGQTDLYAVTEAVNNANLYRYIAKPWDGNDLLLTVREAIKGFYQDRQLAEQNILLERHNKNLEQLVEERTQQLLAEKGKNDELVQRELQYARSIQEGLLPQEPLFPQDPRIDCCGKMSTAREVGGDFYDIYFLDKKHIFFVIADVCGKGLPAALFMVRAIEALRAQTGSESFSPDYTARLIARLNQQLCAYNSASQFLTAFCGILDLNTLKVYYVNAGHNPPLVAIGNQAFHYLTEPINPFVGMVEGLSYRAGEIQLSPGSVLLLYTDGVTEAEDKDVNMLGEDRLLERLKALPDCTAKQLVDTVFSVVRDFAADAKQSDDITVLAIRCSA